MCTVCTYLGTHIHVLHVLLLVCVWCACVCVCVCVVCTCLYCVQSCRHPCSWFTSVPPSPVVRWCPGSAVRPGRSTPGSCRRYWIEVSVCSRVTVFVLVQCTYVHYAICTWGYVMVSTILCICTYVHNNMHPTTLQ